MLARREKQTPKIPNKTTIHFLSGFIFPPNQSGTLQKISPLFSTVSSQKLENKAVHSKKVRQFFFEKKQVGDILRREISGPQYAGAK